MKMVNERAEGEICPRLEDYADQVELNQNMFVRD